MSTKRPMSTMQVADLLQVDQKTVNRWAQNGVLASAERLNGSRGAWMFDPDEVEALATKRRAELEAKLARIGGAR